MFLKARGTSEPGDFGVIVGDPLVRAVTASIPTARGYAVQVSVLSVSCPKVNRDCNDLQYPADMSQTCVAEKRNGSVTIGANDIVDRLSKQSAACPNQKFALVGYSQGASVARAASVRVDPAIYSKIVALVMFGDPGLKSTQTIRRSPAFPAALQSKLRENCASGDRVRIPSTPDLYTIAYNNIR
jgi:cutinase